MFIRQNIQTLRFFRTTPAMRCPYLPHRLETKLVTELSGPDAISQHDTLTDAGFRRSHHFVYKPLCDGCRACVPVRIRVRDFEPSRAQRRIVRRNEHVHAVETQALATGEQYALFSRYVLARHRDGDVPPGVVAGPRLGRLQRGSDAAVGRPGAGVRRRRRCEHVGAADRVVAVRQSQERGGSAQSVFAGGHDSPPPIPPRGAAAPRRHSRGPVRSRHPVPRPSPCRAPRHVSR